MALPIVRRFNRRPVLAVAVSIMLVSYIYSIVIAFVWKEGTVQFINLIIAATLFMIGFNCSWGSLYFTIYGEVFPLAVKTFFMNYT